ncbi:DUF6082 family protein [Streptomyces sp. S1]|uniref:DUF6082 family protein n=1 Tax=Streptomyces sp. S1 TaxID=718288 RepID=UPI003D756EC7
MKTALLAGAALYGAARLALKHRHHKENQHLALVGRHSDLLRDSASDSRLAGLVNSASFSALDEDTKVKYLTANRWLSLWSFMFQTGFLSNAGMRETARGFMEAETNRTFWELAGPHRHRTARDKHARRFNRVMDEAFAGALRPSAA